jgi:hypothetical protein
MTKLIFSKKSLHLNEDNTTQIALTGVTQPSELNKEVAKVKRETPQIPNDKKEYTLSGEDVANSQKGDNNPVVQIDVSKYSDPYSAVKDTLKNPTTASLATQNKLDMKLINCCVTFSKKEIREMLKK